MNAFTAISPPAEAAAPNQIVSRDPATGAVVWRGDRGDPAAAVRRAVAAGPEFAAGSLALRIEMMRRFANEARHEADAFARLVSSESGKPLWDARAEVEAVVARVEIAARGHGERAAQRRLNSALSGSLAIRHKPLGVMAAITGCGQPALVPAGHVIPALIAGNAVILKPSEKCPASAAMLVELMHRAGVPEAALQLLVGGAEAGQALVADERVDGIIFSGGAQTGLGIARRMANRPDRMLCLELGGNNPLVVWDTPLIEDAAALIVQSAFGAGGLRCTSARRLIVKEALFEPVMAAVTGLVDRILIGAPGEEPAPWFGPVPDMESADGLTGSFIWLMSNGGKPIRHMRRPRGDRPFITPGLIDVTDIAERPDVELFGPLLQVIRVPDFEAALAEANATRFGLVAGLIGGTPELYQRFWAGVRAGMVVWNRPTTSDFAAAPMGGAGLSGNHRAGGFYAADHCSYPVSAAELEQPRALAGVGFRA